MSRSIRTATITDAPVLRELSIDTFVQTFACDNTEADMAMYVANDMALSTLSAELVDPENVFFLAFEGDTPIGYAKVCRNTLPDELMGHTALEIARLYVLQQYHSRQVGAALMQHCISFAQGLGCTDIWLGVWEHNVKAIAFYERWGFMPFGSHPFILGTDHQTDILMKKKI